MTTISTSINIQIVDGHYIISLLPSGSRNNHKGSVACGENYGDKMANSGAPVVVYVEFIFLLL
jgi:hypothetical protein